MAQHPYASTGKDNPTAVHLPRRLVVFFVYTLFSARRNAPPFVNHFSGLCHPKPEARGWMVHTDSGVVGARAEGAKASVTLGEIRWGVY